MKKIVIVVLLLAVVAAGYFSLPAYRHWKQRRFLAKAQEYYAKADLRNAALSAREALALNSADIGACRIMAHITEGMRLPIAADWWQKVVNLQPGPASNRLDLARAALMLGDYPRAGRVLQSISPTNQESATFHQLAAMVAVADNNLPAADWHFAQAARLDPRNKAVQFDEAVLHLQTKNPESVDRAEKAMLGLTSDPQFRRDALRHLALASVRNRNFVAAEEFARQLQSETNATFDDDILQLSVLQEASSADFAGRLAALKAAAAGQPEHIYTLTAWLGSHGLAGEASQWLATLPDTLQTNSAVRMARADTLMALNDWVGLANYLQDQSWGEYEFIRLAQLARANHEQKMQIVAEDNWQAAIHATGDRLKPLVTLSRLAAAWQWDSQREELLWRIVKHYPGERWALQSLNQLYLAGGDTRGLQKIYATLVDNNPADLIAKNNLATVDLLLNLQISEAAQMAREAYLKYPKNSAFATTYAYALHVQGSTADGLKILESLAPPQLEQPGVAVYYASLLAASGQTNKAAKYLDLAATGKLLPEETSLLRAARGTP
jgi:predicted Zn-dependent protease